MSLRLGALRIGHCPDPDDAFIFYALTHGKVRVEGVELTPVLEEIELLNRRALAGEVELSAISAAAYPQVAERYRILESGAALALGSGPILVGKDTIPPEEIPERVVAVPGQYTTATLLLKLYLGDDLPIIVVPFDKIPKVVLEGQADLGLLIHEGPITYEAQGLTKVMDLGERWFQETRLPLPLGVNVVRRDLGEDLGRKLSEAVRASIRYAQRHRDEATDYALRYGRGMDAETCRRFIEMYVNDYAMSLGDEGRQALRYLYRRADGAGLLRAPDLDII